MSLTPRARTSHETTKVCGTEPLSSAQTEDEIALVAGSCVGRLARGLHEVVRLDAVWLGPVAYRNAFLPAHSSVA